MSQGRKKGYGKKRTVTMTGGYQKKYASTALAVVTKLVGKKAEQNLFTAQGKIVQRIKEVKRAVKKR